MRVGQRTMMIGYYTLVRKEVRRFIRIWPQTLMSPMITATLYLVVFGKVIGSRVGAIDGVDYIQFIVPGLVMMQVVMLSYINTSSTVFSAKFSKSIEEILVSPLSNHIVLLAYTTASLLRAILVGIIISLLALFFVHLHIKHILVMIVVVVLTSSFFSTLGMINSLYAKKFDDINIIPTFILTPLTYLGGVFYPISKLPGMWQHVSLFNPIAYTIDVFRYGMLGISGINIVVAIAILLALSVGAYLFCLHLLNKGVGLRD